MTASRQTTGRTKVAVVGSGFGGLAVAVRLQNAGFETTVFEARDKPGGRAYVYEQDGFTFDAGPTVITAPHVFEELFREAGRRLTDYVELLEVEPFYRLQWEDGTRFDYDGDTESMVARIEALNPADGEGYLDFVEYAKKVFRAGYEELAATPFQRFRDMVRAAPDLIRLRADRSVYDAVSRFVEDERVRQALSFHSLLVGGNPFETSSIYTLIHHLERKWGVFFPRGGTGSLVRALVRLFEELGGELRLNEAVERIEPVESVETDGTARGGRATATGSAGGAGMAVGEEGTDGRRRHRISTSGTRVETFDLVVSNADLHHTYADLLESVPEARRMERRLERMEWSMSLFVLYFGTDRRYDDSVAHHTILFGPRYRGLLHDIFHGDGVPEDFSLYLHAPTVTDPGLAPAGHEAFYVLAPVPHLGNAPVDWDSFAPAYADRIFEYLESLLPDLRKHVVTRRWFTPADFRVTLRSYQGSAFSCAPLLTQSAWFRPHNRDDRIPGLYLVGAGTHPGAGVPGVMNSAKATASLILEDFSP